MNFGQALQFILAGQDARLPTWSPEVRIKLHHPELVAEKMTAPYLYVESRHGRVLWLPTQIEILSDAWLAPARNARTVASRSPPP